MWHVYMHSALHAYYTIAPAVCYYNKSAIFIIIRQLEKEGSLLPGSSSPCFLTQKCSFFTYETTISPLTSATLSAIVTV